MENDNWFVFMLIFGLGAGVWAGGALLFGLVRAWLERRRPTRGDLDHWECPLDYWECTDTRSETGTSTKTCSHTFTESGEEE